MSKVMAVEGSFTLSKTKRESKFLPPANEVWGKVIFLHQFVILFTGGSSCTPPGTRYTPPPSQVHPLGPGTPPWDQVPPRPGTPPRTRYTPGTRYPPGPGTPPLGPGTLLVSPLRDTVNVRVVRILLECNLVFFDLCRCSMFLYKPSGSDVTSAFVPI